MDEPDTDLLDIELLTGLQFRDTNGLVISKVGNPNNKEQEAQFFPNPVQGVFSVFSLRSIRNIWLAPAVVSMDYEEVDFDIELSELNYSREEVEQIQIRTIDAAGTNNITIDVSDFTAGYYRIFYEFIDGEIAWDNAYIDPDTDFLSSSSFLLSEW